MIKRVRVRALFCLAICFSASTVSAHYYWVTIDPKTGPSGAANLYFEEGPAPGDGQYLDPFLKRSKTWIRTVEAPKSKLLKTVETKQKDKRWLTAPLPQAAPRSIESYVKWGVYRYGKTDVLLHYYARNLDVHDHDDLHELAHAENLLLDIAPHDLEKEMEVHITWNGKPAANRPVYVRGPKKFKETLTTDEKGRAAFQPAEKGSYTIRTFIEEKDNSGEFEGKEYQMVRHHGTLIMQLPLE